LPLNYTNLGTCLKGKKLSVDGEIMLGFPRPKAKYLWNLESIHWRKKTGDYLQEICKRFNLNKLRGRDGGPSDYVLGKEYQHA